MIPKRPVRVYHLQLGLALGFGKHPPCPIDDAVKTDDALGPLQVVHTPGHSPGHLAFYWPERKVLIAGDAIVTWPEFAAGWPAFNLNPRQQQESLRHLAKLEAEVVGVGHGEPITRGGADRVRELAEREA